MNHNDYPALYQSASDLSKRAQSAFYRAFLGHMALLAVASAISVINSSCPEVAIIQALALIGALGCALYLYFVRPDRRWYSARAIAESMKTITWRYISRAEPFNNLDQADRHDFVLKVRAILEQNNDVAGLLSSFLDGVQISDEMDRLRQASVEDRSSYYRTYRIVDQQTWYAKKANTNRRMVNRYFIALIVTIGIAILFAIAKIRFPTAPFWPTDFFVTVAAALLSWIQAKKFQELAVSYTLAAHEISLIRQQASLPMSDDELSIFVQDAENAFSREHTQWTARKDR